MLSPGGRPALNQSLPAAMKRKKWSAEEEATLIREYAAFLSPLAQSSGGALLLDRLRRREKKFQPIADRVNAAHHFRDAKTFPFRWSWRDISVKIHNMRHQFLHVKRKIHSPPSHLHSEHALHLCPNFILYKQVFGYHPAPFHRTSLGTPASDENHSDDDSVNEEDGGDDDVEEEDGVPVADDLSYSGQEFAEKDEWVITTTVEQEEESAVGLELRRKGPSRFRRKKMEFLRSKMVHLGEIAMRREEKRREREAVREQECRERELQKRAFMHRRELDEEEERRQQWSKRRRREERSEVEDMEWRERILMMQMEHEKQTMQMQDDAFQAQMQMIVILVRIICQFLGGRAGGGDSGIGGMQHHVMQPQQQEPQESPEALVGDNGKNGDYSSRHYV